MFTTRRSSERGQGLVEYALILVLVATAIIIILSLTGKQVAEKLWNGCTTISRRCAFPTLNIRRWCRDQTCFAKRSEAEFMQ